MNTLKMIGGPLDGRVIQNQNGYFKEGDFEAVNTLDMTDKEGWSAESIYRVQDGNLVYDPEATAKWSEASKP